MGPYVCDAFSAELSEDGSLVVAGEIDTLSAPTFHAALQAAAGASDGDIVVDLAKVTFLDSAGMNALVRVFKVLDEQQRALVLRNTIASVRRALEVGGAASFAEFR